ncbi:MAG: hypothetical protein JNK11_05365 [Alphaproteobacteria bacterium]|nr:hypothetical protein [Alphaproteobacteria bacterium]
MADQGNSKHEQPVDSVLAQTQLDLIRRTAQLLGDPRPAARAVLRANIEAIDHLNAALSAADRARRAAESELPIRPLAKVAG